VARRAWGKGARGQTDGVEKVLLRVPVLLVRADAVVALGAVGELAGAALFRPRLAFSMLLCSRRMERLALLSLSDYALVLLFMWRFVWGLYERAHIIRYFPPLASAPLAANWTAGTG
jgi:hypothetical protein